MKTLAFLLLIFSINIFAWDAIEIEGVLTDHSSIIEVVASPKKSIIVNQTTLDWRNSKLVHKTPAVVFSDIILKVSKGDNAYRSLNTWLSFHLNGQLEKKAISLIRKDANGQEVFRENCYESFPYKKIKRGSGLMFYIATTFCEEAKK